MHALHPEPCDRSSYQLDLVTPGMNPADASSRNVRRETLNRRMKARRRPLTSQRFTTRVGLASRRLRDALVIFLCRQLSTQRRVFFYGSALAVVAIYPGRFRHKGRRRVAKKAQDANSFWPPAYLAPRLQTKERRACSRNLPLAKAFGVRGLQPAERRRRFWKPPLLGLLCQVGRLARCPARERFRSSLAEEAWR